VGTTGDASAGVESVEADDQQHSGPGPVLRGVRVLSIAVLVYVLIIEVLLAIGFVCVLFGVEPSAWIVDVVYRSVERVMAPFRGIFSAIEFGTGSSEPVEPAIESSILFAMVVYGIIALVANDLAEWIGRPHKE